MKLAQAGIKPGTQAIYRCHEPVKVALAFPEGTKPKGLDNQEIPASKKLQRIGRSHGVLPAMRFYCVYFEAAGTPMSTETVAWMLGAGLYSKPLEDACIRFGIVSELSKAHFLAQVAHESAGFRTATEYASGKAYEGRRDLGNVKPGDGVRYKGRGLIQCTGRANYAEYSLDTYGDDRCVRDPFMVAKLPDAALVAGWFWQKRGLNKYAEQDDLRAVTKRINGGYNGLADREQWLIRAKRAFKEIRDA